MSTNQDKKIDIYKTELRKEVGQKIFNARKAKKMSRAALGEKIGLHETTIKKYEDGNLKNVKISTLRDFAKALEIDMGDLIDKYPYNNKQETLDKEVQKITVYNCLIKTKGVTKQKDIEVSINNAKKDHHFFYPKNKEVAYLLKNAIDEIVNPYPEYNSSSLIYSELFGLRVNDDSINKLALEGMYAIVRFTRPSNGELAVIIIDDHPAIIREFRQYDKYTVGLKSWSYNDEYRHWLFEGKEDYSRLSIVGTVIGFVTPRASHLHSNLRESILYQAGEL